MSKPVPQEFFYVACKRKDSTPPGLEKAYYGRFFLTREDAAKLVEEIENELDFYGSLSVFQAYACWNIYKPDDCF